MNPSPKLLSTLFLAAALGPALSAQEPLVLSKTIPLQQISGGFNHHSADGRRDWMFVCATSNKTVEVVDLRSGRIVKTLPGEKPSATCFAPDLDLLCVSRGKSPLQIYDGSSFALVASLPMPCSVDELHYDPRTRRLLGGCMNAPNEGIVLVDLVQRRVLGEIKTPQPQGFCIEDGGSRVFVCTPKANQVTVVDLTKLATSNPWSLGASQGDYPAAYDSATHRLFVGCRRPIPQLLVYDTDTGRIVAKANTAKDTDDISFDPVRKRIYVACGEGAISVIQQDDPDHYRSLDSVATVPGARNCVFLPETGEFCVTVPQRPGQQAAILVYRSR